ncbi:MAG: hypothetical protein ACE5HJ_04900 [Thermoplasmata archaeon]
MIVAKTKGLGSLISLEVDGELYDVSTAGRGFLKRIFGQTYSVVERASGTQALVKYKVLANRIEIEKNETKASLRLRTVRPSRLVLAGEEYQVTFGKLHGTIDIAREGETVASGSIQTTSVSFQEGAGPIKSILPELAVGLCIWLKNFQGFLGAMVGGQA